MVGFALGNLVDVGEKAYKNGNYAKAYELFTKACDSGDAGGCYGMGSLHENDWSTRQSNAKAKEYYAKACDLGVEFGFDDYKKLNKRLLNYKYHKIYQTNFARLKFGEIYELMSLH